MTDVAREIGAHEEAIETLKAEVAALRKDIAEIKEMIAGTKGSVRMLVTIGGIAASLGAALGWLVDWYRHP